MVAGGTPTTGADKKTNCTKKVVISSVVNTFKMIALFGHNIK